MTLTLGIDLGGTKLAGGVVDSDGTLVLTGRRPTPTRDAAATVAALVDLVAELTADYEVEAIGIGAAGFIDSARSRVLFAPNLGWIDEPLKDQVERHTGVPVVVENDALAAAWGEYRFGAGRGEAHQVMVTVGTGIGGGIVVDGRPLRGAFGAAAEIGHLQIVADGLMCGCGLSGCWEQYASGNALVRIARHLAGTRRGDASVLLALGDGTPEGVQGAHVTAAARAGDPVACAAFDDLGGWLGRGLADLAAVLDPGRFVIGGGVSAAGELLLAPARESYLAHLTARAHRPVAEVVLASLGNAAGMVGAADLARHH